MHGDFIIATAIIALFTSSCQGIFKNFESFGEEWGSRCLLGKEKEPSEESSLIRSCWRIFRKKLIRTYAGFQQSVRQSEDLLRCHTIAEQMDTDTLSADEEQLSASRNTVSPKFCFRYAASSS